ncbi:MAG: peptidase M20, partial [Candidatus Marinimicrobia bacterium]|nr:peptidase M20 [Candidatus Neomarinimicrobiota bacterium]
MNTNQLQATINTFWEDRIIPALFEYIKIPNKSPSFDPEWKANGHMDRVLNLATEWA